MSAVSPGTAALNAPIGVFGSGVGGLSVLRALRAEMPHEHFVYFADSGHAPYGERDAAKVIERSRAVLAALRADHGIKALVIACNTALALDLHLLGEPAACRQRVGHFAEGGLHRLLVLRHGQIAAHFGQVEVGLISAAVKDR